MKRFITLFLILSVALTVQGQIPQQPSVDYEIYYGYEWGAAGIAESLIKAASATKNSGMLNQSIAKAADYVVNNRFQFQGKQYFAWEKGPNLQTGIYPGIKYGAAGIILFLSEAYKYTHNGTYLDYAEKAMQELMNEAIDNSSKPHWGYSYGTPSSNEGISLTGLSFGSAGVIKAAISLFNATGEKLYLQQAQDMFDWIASVSESKGADLNGIPWYSHVPGFASVEIYEYSRGMAGIIPQLMQLGNLMQNDTIRQFAISVGSYLTHVQKDDGSWTVQNDTDASTPFFATGTSGIIYGLYQTDQNVFLNAIRKGVDNLLSKLDNGLIEDENHQNSLFEGTLGIYHSLFTVRKIMEEDQVEKLNSQFEKFLSSQIVIAKSEEKELTLLKLNPETASRYDLSLGAGLAGLLYMLMENDLNPSILIDNQEISVLENVADTLALLQNFNGSWNRQITIKGFTVMSNTQQSTPFPILAAMAALPIIAKKIKNRRA